MADIACPIDPGVKEKEQEKLDKYNNMKYEIEVLWDCNNVQVMPPLTGVLQTVSKDFEEFVEHLAVDFNFSALQKECSLGTARILRRVLDTLGWMMQLAIQLKTSYKLNIQD